MNRRTEPPRLPVIAFVNAGDPDLRTTEALLRRLDRLGVVGVELCVPYADPYTDGATLRRSHARALPQGVDLDAVLGLVQRLRPDLRLRIYLMADWSHTVKPMGLAAFIECVAPASIDGLLLHGLPPVMRARCDALMAAAGIAPVVTVYLNGKAESLSEQAATTAGFIYLVSQYGAAGATVGFSDEKLAAIRAMRQLSNRPMYVGFGIQSADDVRAVMGAGADGVVVGGAFIAAIEPHLHNTSDLLDAADTFLARLCTEPALESPTP